MLITSKSHHLSINAIKMNTIDTLTNINDMTLNCCALCSEITCSCLFDGRVFLKLIPSTISNIVIDTILIANIINDIKL